MDLMSYFDIARRRWPLVLGTVCAALLVTWITLPSVSGATPKRVTSYQATATIAANPMSQAPMNLAIAALYATIGDVPKRAALQLGYDGEPQALASTVSAAAMPETATLTISSSGTDKRAVQERVNVFTAELIAYFQRSQSDDVQRQLDLLNGRIDEHRERLRQLDRKIRARPGDNTLLAERSGIETSYQALVSQTASLEGQLTAVSPLEVLQEAVALPIETSVVGPPTDTSGRLLVGGGLGLVLGAALALVVERLDVRVRTRDQAEQAFHLPVIAEIPLLPRRDRKASTILSASDPGSATAEAYRSLRSAVLLLAPVQPGHSDGSGVGPGPQVIMVTSPRAHEGKTSTVANLAVVMAESGRRVLVLSLDFRNPRIHQYFDLPKGAGLSDLLVSGRSYDLPNIVRETRYPGIRVAGSGNELAHPGALLAGVGAVIAKARGLADVVLIDTAPLLSVSDAVDISPHVDAALVVSRANRTTAGQAAEAQRLLSRLGVPALGAVLVGSPSASMQGYPHASSSLSRQLAHRFGVTPRRSPSEESNALAALDYQERNPHD